MAGHPCAQVSLLREHRDGRERCDGGPTAIVPKLNVDATIDRIPHAVTCQRGWPCQFAALQRAITAVVVAWGVAIQPRHPEDGAALEGVFDPASPVADCFQPGGAGQVTERLEVVKQIA